MIYDKLVEALNATRNGAFTRVIYKTELPVKSIYKNLGISIKKQTEITVRFGVKYKNIKSVKERLKIKEKQASTSNYKTVIPNKLVYNTNTDKYYVCAFPIKTGSNCKSTYHILVNDIEILSFTTTDDIKHLVIDSYWKKPFRETFRVDAENIIKIGKFALK